MRYGPKLVIKIVKPKISQFDIDLENDPFYLDGKEEGRDETNYNFVFNLLAQTDFSDEKIASLANVPLTFVEEVKKSLAENKD